MSSGRPCTFEVLVLTHRECLLGLPDSSVHRTYSMPKLRPGCSPPSQPRNPLGWRHHYGLRSPQGGDHWTQVGVSHHPWRLHVGPGAAWMLLPSTGHVEGPWSCWGFPLSYGCPLTPLSLDFSSFHQWGWTWSFPFPHGSTYWGGCQDLVPLASNQGEDWDWSADGQVWDFRPGSSCMDEAGAEGPSEGLLMGRNYLRHRQ